MKVYTVHSIGGLIRDYNCDLAIEAYILFRAYCIENGIFDSVEYITDRRIYYRFKSEEINLEEIEGMKSLSWAF